MEIYSEFFPVKDVAKGPFVHLWILRRMPTRDDGYKLVVGWSTEGSGNHWTICLLCSGHPA
jgi:hypothetical protein